ncbi:MAG: beta-aspartyl-peptidase [Halieaceae bacterium]|jgi:beta-aspartyl-dipeptidase (metallo-type)|nr:beta-aspartyl-peptidase [Halieaceae bacterium]
MMQLITNANVYDPSPLGLKDVLVAGARIVAITEPGVLSLDCEALDADGGSLLPGLVDTLTHPCGGGGEGGFGNRTAEMSASDFINAGVLTPVGALGTDSIGRSLEVLYGTVMGLRAEGVDAFMYTGSYRVPAPTLTGDVTRDLYLVDPIVGVGEVAIADHRGTQPSAMELRRLAAETSLGGTLTGLGGTVMVHVGDGDSRLALLREAIEGSDLPASVFYPTHINRSQALLDEAIEWARLGGFVDITVSTTPELVAAGDIPALEALRYLLDAGAPLEQITCSSDAGGSLPLYVDGELQGLTAASPGVLLELLQQVANEAPRDYAVALATMTINPARALKLPGRGRLSAEGLANLVLMAPDAGGIRGVMGQGKWLLKP